MSEPSDLTRARRGARALDRILGKGWRRKIRKTRLDMGCGTFYPDSVSSCGCILAQLRPGKFYLNTARELGLEDKVDDYGFAGDVDEETWLKVLREGVKS